MISAQEMVREVNNYRDNNKKIVEEYLEEISNRIYDVAKRGESETEIDLWNIARQIPSNKREYKTLEDILYDKTECPSIGLQEAIWNKLREKGFRLELRMCFDGYHHVEYIRIVKW